MTFRLILALLLTMSLPACVVMKSTHDEALAKIQNLETDLTKKDQELQAMSENLNKAVKEQNLAAAKAKEIEAVLLNKTAEIEKFRKDAENINQKNENIASEIKEVQVRAESILVKIREMQKITATYRHQEGVVPGPQGLVPVPH